MKISRNQKLIHIIAFILGVLLLMYFLGPWLLIKVISFVTPEIH